MKKTKRGTHTEYLKSKSYLVAFGLNNIKIVVH